jgi:UDPglucose--hexose-1-phosphate uridylyltransferase
MNELRKDPLLNRWVAVMKDSKTLDFYLSETWSKIETVKDTEKDCMLCLSMASETPKEIFSIRDETSTAPLRWHTKVIPWPNYVFQIEGDLGRKAVGMYDSMNSLGANEIIIEHPLHNIQPEEAGIKQMGYVLKTYKYRYMDLERDFRLRYTIIYKDCNNSSGIGGHAHSKVISPPVIPKGIKDELDGARQFYYYKERCIFCDMLTEELALGKRVIMETRDFTAFIPYAPRMPFECWILPKRHDCAYQSITDSEIDDLALILSSVIKKFKKAFKGIPCGYVIHNAPNRMPRKDYWHTIGEDFHWHIEVMPRLKAETGFEVSSDFYVLHTSPEDAAKFIQEVR